MVSWSGYHETLPGPGPIFRNQSNRTLPWLRGQRYHETLPGTRCLKGFLAFQEEEEEEEEEEEQNRRTCRSYQWKKRIFCWSACSLKIRAIQIIILLFFSLCFSRSLDEPCKDRERETEREIASQLCMAILFRALALELLGPLGSVDRK